jgi:hypothetical protein
MRAALYRITRAVGRYAGDKSQENVMTSTWKSGVWGSLLVLAAGLLLGMNLSQPAVGGGTGKAATAAPRYTVVQTGVTGLLVTDNDKHTLYFYSADADSEPGADLKLRGTVDLSQVGKKVLSPRPVKK